MRVVDTLNPTQPESLNVIAWKRGMRDDCVQGMGVTWTSRLLVHPEVDVEGAYDNTAGTVAIMMYAQVLVDSKWNATPSLRCGPQKRRGCGAQTSTTIVRLVCLKIRSCGFTSTWT